MWAAVELAKRLGAEHPGFHMTPWELIDQMLKASGMPGADAMYEAGGIDFAPKFETAHFLDGFAHPDKKFHFKPDWKAFGGRWQEMPVLPDQGTDEDGYIDGTVLMLEDMGSPGYPWGAAELRAFVRDAMRRAYYPAGAVRPSTAPWAACCRRETPSPGWT